jgi:hypothetical protein
MALLKLSIGAVLLAFVTFIGRTEAYCNQVTIERCLAPLTSLPKDGRVTEEQFDTACNGLSSTTPCLRQAGCPMTDPLFSSIWKGLIDGMEYLCGEGRAVYMSGHNCMLPQSYQGVVSACNVTYINSVSANVYAFCSATNDFTKCVRRALYTSCTPDFAMVYLRFFKLFTSPIIAVVDRGCRIDYFGTNTIRFPSRRPQRSVLVNAQYTKDALKFLGESDQHQSMFKFIATAPESLLNQLVDDAV